jgi:hypothetical protein
VARLLREIPDRYCEPAEIRRAKAALRQIAGLRSAPRPPRRSAPKPADTQIDLLDLKGMTPVEMVLAIRKEAAEEEERAAEAGGAGIDSGKPTP